MKVQVIDIGKFCVTNVGMFCVTHEGSIIRPLHYCGVKLNKVSDIYFHDKSQQCDICCLSSDSQ